MEEESWRWDRGGGIGRRFGQKMQKQKTAVLYSISAPPVSLEFLRGRCHFVSIFTAT